MKIVQKIETGGTSKTSTPIFKYLTKLALFVSEARHITHWAGVDSENTAMTTPTSTAANA